MNKKELVKAVAEETGLTVVDAGKALDSITGVITKAITEDNDVTLVGWGTFKQSFRKARTGRNPRTGDTIEIKASKGVSFKAGKQFKEAVNG